MQPLFIGNHPAIDFLNTFLTPEGQEAEMIGDGRSLLEWLVAAQLIDASTSAKLSRKLGVKGLDACAAHARKVRDWAREWLARWRERPLDNYAQEISFLNKLLASAAFHHEVIADKGEYRFMEQPEVDSADALIAHLAMQIAALITQEQPALVKSCAGHQCSLWFLDRTKAHRRLFCSASTCGNRAKVAAFRQRQNA